MPTFAEKITGVIEISHAILLRAHVVSWLTNFQLMACWKQQPAVMCHSSEVSTTTLKKEIRKEIVSALNSIGMALYKW